MLNPLHVHATQVGHDTYSVKTEQSSAGHSTQSGSAVCSISPPQSLLAELHLPKTNCCTSGQHKVPLVLHASLGVHGLALNLQCMLQATL